MRRRAKPSSIEALKPGAWAARLSVGYEDFAHLGRSWTRADVRRLRAHKPQWLTAARRRYAARQDEVAAQERGRGPALGSFDCFCCGTEFAFTADRGGLCEACNEDRCPNCAVDGADRWWERG